MMLKEFPCSAATRGVVRAYRVARFSLPEAGALPVKLFTPKAEHSLQFFTRGEEWVEYGDGRRLRFNCALTGSHDELTRRTVSREFSMVQVSFEPEALHRLTGVPGAELHNQYLDASVLFGSDVLRLNDRLANIGAAQEQVAVADAHIAQWVSRARAPAGVDRALRALRDDPAASVTRLAAASGLSLRQFERLCGQRMGVGPKAVVRLARFDRAFNARLQHPERDWLQIAVDCGYHDYQHMARDFKAFAGLTPPQLLQAHASAPECRLGLRQQFDLSYPG